MPLSMAARHCKACSKSDFPAARLAEPATAAAPAAAASAGPAADDRPQQAVTDTLEPPDPAPRWKTLATRTVYENDWIEVSHRDVVAPTGHAGIYGVVHFRNRAVGVVPLDDEGYTWLVGQWRYTLDAWSWEIPEGGAPPDEAPLDAARRELAEETGLVARHWSPLLEMHTSNSVTDECAVAYLARGLSAGASAPDETEVLSVKRLPLSEAVAMALDGRISDGFAMAALLKVELLRQSGQLPA